MGEDVERWMVAELTSIQKDRIQDFYWYEMTRSRHVEPQLYAGEGIPLRQVRSGVDTPQDRPRSTCVTLSTMIFRAAPGFVLSLYIVSAAFTFQISIDAYESLYARTLLLVTMTTPRDNSEHD